MNPWHLVWIIPISGFAGYQLAKIREAIQKGIELWDEHEKETEEFQ